MKKLWVLTAGLLAAVVFCLFGCHQDGTIPSSLDPMVDTQRFPQDTIPSASEEPTAFIPQIGVRYEYKNQAGHILAFQRVSSDRVNFQMEDGPVICGTALSQEGAFAFSGDGWEILCGNPESMVTAPSEADSGLYYICPAEPEAPLPTAPALPEFSPDPNTEGFSMDATLAQAIRHSEGLPEDALLTREWLEQLTSLYLWDTKLVSLQGIENLPNLEIFFTDTNNLRDLSPLCSLEHLQQVSIGSGYIRKLPDLAGLPELRELSLTGNLIEDLTPLSKGKGLRYVNLNSNRITSIAPLAEVTWLEGLSLEGNCILDYASVADNEALCAALQAFGADVPACLALETRAKEIVAQVTDPAMSELEKEYVLYRYVMEHMEFDDSPRGQRPFGYWGIMEGRGVCGDYAEALALLGNTAGLTMLLISSETHAWNMIRLGDRYYHVDALWDDSEGEKPLYFNCSTAFLSDPDHQYDWNCYPVAGEMDLLEYAHLLPPEK